MISLHYHRILLFSFLLFLSLILLFHFTYPHSLNFNLNLNPGFINNPNSNIPFKKQKYITKEGKSINQQNIIQLRAKLKEGKYPALRKLLDDGVLGVGGKNRENFDKGGGGGEKVIHQVWHNWEGGFGRRVERRGEEDLDGRIGEEKYGIGIDMGMRKGKGKGKINIAEDKEGWEVRGGDGKIPHEWEERRGYCRGVNEQTGWKYVLWTSRKSLALVKTHYPSFLKTYISYPSNSQRVEAVKCLLLHRYGGIVLDMDTICLRSLDPFLMLGLFVVSEPLLLSSSSFSSEDNDENNDENEEKRKGTLSTRIIGAPRNHGFVVELIDVLMGYNAPGVDGDGERERDGGKGELSLTGKLRKGEKLKMGRREVFGEVWDAYHRRIGEGVLDVDVTNTTVRMGDEREKEDREELGLLDSVGWRVSVLRTGEGVGRGFFGPHSPNSKHPSIHNTSPQSKIPHTSPTHLLLPLLPLISLSLLITLIFYSHHRSHTRKQPLIRRASSRYERGRRRERVLRGAGLGGENSGGLYNGYGGSGYGGEVMEGTEKEERGLVAGGGCANGA